MTRDQLLQRILHSGEITKVSQHLALVIFLLTEGSNQLTMSVRDLERITGWSKSVLADHLRELDMFIRVKLGRGRAKSVFELQGTIEDAITTAVVSASRTQEAPIASAERTQPDLSVQQPDATADLSASRTQEQRLASSRRTQEAEQKKGLPHTPSKENNSLSLSESEAARASEKGVDTTVRVNCSAIHGPDFVLDFGAIDMAAGLIGMPKERARAIAEICARDWAANGQKPQYPMAMVKAALRSEANQAQVQAGRKFRHDQDGRIAGRRALDLI